MKKRIVSAALAVLMLSGLGACAGSKKNETPSTTAATSETLTQPSSTRAEIITTTLTTAATTATTTTVSTTVKEKLTEIISTTKKILTTKPSETVVTTTAPLFDANKPLDYYKKVENAFREDLKYGVFRRRSVTDFIETLSDGTEITVKQDIAEYYNRTFYRASYEDLLPAANENMEFYTDSINEVLSIINGYRKKGDLEPLELSKTLTVIACVRAEEIAWSGAHSHRRPNGRMFSSILKEAGITTGIVGENIGWGYETAQDVCIAWKNSESHYENIMNPDFTEIGIGVSADPDPDRKLCWAQLFM